MQTEIVEYQHNGKTFAGFFANDDTKAGEKPLVVIAHAWAGRSDFENDKAKALAELGYAAFALDVYGKGILGTSVAENSQLLQPFLDDRQLLRDRLQAGIVAASECRGVDKHKIAAIGFCFGGLCVFDLARMGMDLKGVVGFHGLFFPAEKIGNKKITAKVLALHGYDDPMATPDQVMAFADEMTTAGADWQLHAFGHTQHAFTNPNANDTNLGTIYNPAAAQRAWILMQVFLDEVFA